MNCEIPTLTEERLETIRAAALNDMRLAVGRAARQEALLAVANTCAYLLEIIRKEKERSYAEIH